MHTLKTPEQIEIMAEGGRRLALVLEALREKARAGVTTKQLDRLAYQMIHKAGSKPAFLHYRPNGADHAYPYTLCASMNSVVVHGQPSDYVLKEGDILKLDLGLSYKGLNVDSAITVAIGKVSKDAERLMAATKKALEAGIAVAEVGNTLGDIGFAIEAVAKKNKCGVAEGLTGHGIGRALHEDPTVWNIGRKGEGKRIAAGLVIAIEPMFMLGKPHVEQLRDESWASADGTLAAHFEHTIAVTENGPRILTMV